MFFHYFLFSIFFLLFADLTAELLRPSAAMAGRNLAGRGYATANEVALASCGEIPATKNTKSCLDGDRDDIKITKSYGSLGKSKVDKWGKFE